MNTSHQGQSMKNQIRALFLGITFSMASAGVSHAMSDLISLSQEPLWPVSSTPDGNLIYTITTVGRGGSGMLEVALTAGAMPDGVTVTFSPSVLRFTGNQLTTQTSTMTVSCPCPTPIDSFPFTITGTSRRESITITNVVRFSAEKMATRLPTLYLDVLTNGVLRLRGLGATAKTYQIQAATDLSNPVWSNLGSSTADGNGRFTFFPGQIANPVARFYRAVLSQ
jgi:hypothetical protein